MSTVEGTSVTDAGDELVAQARQGSRDAFSQLVLLHQGRVRAYLGRYVKDRLLAEDLAQETFLMAYRALAAYRQEAPVAMWLLGIARNVALMYLRDEQRRRSRTSQFLEAAMAGWRAERLQSAAAGGEQRDRELDALEGCLQKLAAASARLVEEYYRSPDATSAAEIARRSGKKESTVRVTLLRIRQALRQCIQAQLSGQGAGR